MSHNTDVAALAQCQVMARVAAFQRVRRMRIFFPNASICYPPTTGGHVHVYQLTKHLRDLGHEIISLQPDQNPITSTRPRKLGSVLSALRSADVLYCRVAETPNHATSLTTSYLRWLIPDSTVVLWELNVSLIGASTVRGRTEARRRADVSSLRRSAHRVDAAIGVTKGLARQAAELLGIENTSAIQNGSDPELFRRDQAPPGELTLDRNKLHVVSIGSNPNSYHDIAVVEALCALIDERQLPIDVHILGRSGDLCVGKRPRSLRLYGAVSYLDMPRYLAQMDVGLALYNIPLDCNSPLKLFDYLASGCVPICSAGEAVEDVLCGKEAGIVSATWTPESLAAVLMRLHKDRVLLAQMRAAGRSLVEREHSWRRVAEKTEGILTGLVRSRARVKARTP